MLRETPRSLRQYFALVAALTLLPVIVLAARSDWPALSTLPIALRCAVALLMAYIAIRLPSLLHRPTLVYAVLGVGLIATIAKFVQESLRGVDTTTAIVTLITIAVYVYLLRSVARLSREARVQPSPNQSPEPTSFTGSNL